MGVVARERYDKSVAGSDRIYIDVSRYAPAKRRSVGGTRDATL